MLVLVAYSDDDPFIIGRLLFTFFIGRFSADNIYLWGMDVILGLFCLSLYSGLALCPSSVASKYIALCSGPSSLVSRP